MAEARTAEAKKPDHIQQLVRTASDVARLSTGRVRPVTVAELPLTRP